jgi:hypothetical protein
LNEGHALTLETSRLEKGDHQKALLIGKARARVLC